MYEFVIGFRLCFWLRFGSTCSSAFQLRWLAVLLSLDSQVRPVVGFPSIVGNFATLVFRRDMDDMEPARKSVAKPFDSRSGQGFILCKLPIALHNKAGRDRIDRLRRLT